VRIPQKPAIAILLVTQLALPTRATGSVGGLVYVSPGLQLGYSWEDGPFLSLQVTAGMGFYIPPIPFAPTIGLTFGVRAYPKELGGMFYMDLQALAFFYRYVVLGAGWGSYWARWADGPGSGIREKRFLGAFKPPRALSGLWGDEWSGFLLLTLDSDQRGRSRKFWYPGLIVVSPHFLIDKGE